MSKALPIFDCRFPIDSSLWPALYNETEFVLEIGNRKLAIGNGLSRCMIALSRTSNLIKESFDAYFPRKKSVRR